MGSCLADRIGEPIDLSANERAALDGLEQRERAFRRGAVSVRENDRLAELYVVGRGTLMSYVILPDGRRQFLRFLFRGDMIAAAGLVYRSSPDTVIALTDCIVPPVERSAVAALAVVHPRLAALLIEIRNRLSTPGNRRGGDGFMLGLTQEDIGDATGLTAVYVNRMLRQLEEESLIARDGGRVTFLDQATLARTAYCHERAAGLDLSSLTEPR